MSFTEEVWTKTCFWFWKCLIGYICPHGNETGLLFKNDSKQIAHDKLFSMFSFCDNSSSTFFSTFSFEVWRVCIVDFKSCMSSIIFCISKAISFFSLWLVLLTTYIILYFKCTFVWGTCSQQNFRRVLVPFDDIWVKNTCHILWISTQFFFDLHDLIEYFNNLILNRKWHSF